MIIECLLKRRGGSFIELDDHTYHFAPNEHEAHVCDVRDNDHIERLLAIPEGFAAYQGKSEPAVNLAKQQAAEPAVESVAAPAEDSEPEAPAELTIEQLRGMYGERFGRAPSARMSEKRLREELGLDEE